MCSEFDELDYRSVDQYWDTDATSTADIDDYNSSVRVAHEIARPASPERDIETMKTYLNNIASAADNHLMAIEPLTKLLEHSMFNIPIFLY